MTTSPEPLNQPIRSTIRCTRADDSTHSCPLVADAVLGSMIAMFGTARPGTKFRFDVSGFASSHAQIVTKPEACASVAVTLSASEVAPEAAAGVCTRTTSPGPTIPAARPIPLRVSSKRLGTAVVTAASTGVATVSAPTNRLESRATAAVSARIRGMSVDLRPEGARGFVVGIARFRRR